MKTKNMSQCDPLTISQKIIDLWNNELGFIFPMELNVFHHNTFGDPNFQKNNSYYVEENSEIIAFVIAKKWCRKDSILDYDKRGWISLIYVKPSYRGRGIGSELLLKVLKKFKKMELNEVYVGRDYQNFFPGVPMDLKKTIPWLEKRGFCIEYETNDLIKDLKNVKNKILLRPNCTNENLVIRFATEETDLIKLSKMVEKNWPGRWHLELLDYIKNCGNGREYLIAILNEQVVGFCKVCDYKTKTVHLSYSMMWRNRFVALGGIGPLGVDVDFRKQNIAYNMIATSIDYLAAQNCDKIIIDWTNLLALYRQFGFEIWKSYTYVKLKWR